MTNIILDKNYQSSDILPLFAGDEECKKGHSFGPYIREHYLIHFVLDGCGILRDKYGEHRIDAGKLFIIRPDEVTFYAASQETPWHYMWISFSGRRSDSFNTEKSVYTAPIEAALKLSELISAGETVSDAYTAVIYELLYKLFGKKSESPDKISQIKSYIDYNYMKECTVGGIAHQFGFERSYLYRSFKNRYGIGLKEYLMRVRTKHAIRFLGEGKTVGETAFLVGFKDEFNFSRAFKKAVGSAPSKYKKTDF